jgi:hypothetical protein
VTKIVFVVALAAVIGRTIASADQKAAAAAAPSNCSAPEFRQFDFWIGDWDAFGAGDTTPIARVRVTRTLDGCALSEAYEDTRGLVGQSISTYDRARQRWHQTWVTNRGQVLLLDDAFATGAMRLEGPDTAAGATARARGTWTRTPDGVREVGETSSDGGKTWRPWFDLTFRLRRF